ncbi:uncharacterized protein [Periplaneta americana]|uniref:uncharacterized protein n=1 Tax=Periplaneta americana TaxID=6978 RepID=UPI0037E96873
MPGQRCAVAVCQSVYKKTTNYANKVSFFSFPKDEEIRKRWIVACKRQNKFNPGTSRICSLHFKSEDFELNFRAQLLKIQPKRPRILKPTAVPTLNLNSGHNAMGKSSSRSQRLEERSHWMLVQDVLREVGERNLMVLMDLIKKEPVVDPLAIQTINHIDVEEKVPLPEETNLFNLCSTKIKMECEHNSYSLTSDIKFEETAVPINSPVVKCEAEVELCDLHIVKEELKL